MTTKDLQQAKIELAYSSGQLSRKIGYSRRTIEGWLIGKKIPTPAEMLIKGLLKNKTQTTQKTA